MRNLNFYIQDKHRSEEGNSIRVHIAPVQIQVRQALLGRFRPQSCSCEDQEETAEELRNLVPSV
ncbi:hypothetical protein RUM43_009128 [Polyplax serrata]|uniref:Uncharacterized protein n=1 Tax=Polyplax serrata TaxID=468196 RepID=A0AAN8NPR7_POLSC